MSNLRRYILIQAIKTNENELIPIWDSRLKFSNSEDFGDEVTIDGISRQTYSTTTECIFDLKTKKISAGIELEIYPDKEQLEFKIGENVYYNTQSGRKIVEVTVDDIIYEEFDLHICKGKEISTWIINSLNLKDIEPKSLYATKTWKPVFVLSNGSKTEWTHQLFHKG